MIEVRRRPSFDIVASSRALEIHSGLALVSMTLRIRGWLSSAILCIKLIPGIAERLYYLSYKIKVPSTAGRLYYLF